MSQIRRDGPGLFYLFKKVSGWRNDYCESEDELVRQFKAALQKKMHDMRREDEEAKRRVYNSGNSGGGK